MNRKRSNVITFITGIANIENLLLAPMSVGVTSPEDKDIKAALFHLIYETQVKL